ncbi:major facilitator superfamily domain-containing protein [Aspergillus spectabilis]
MLTSANEHALPTIVRDLNSGDSYVWISNAYMLTMAAFQPLYGQIANIFGRHSLTILAVVLFSVGSAVSRAAKSTAALIAGRAIQGIGGGGINVVVDIIVCDLLPLRVRPKYMGVIFLLFAVALFLGPVIGDLITQRVTLCLIFYLNLPICGAVLLIIPFLKVEAPRTHRLLALEASILFLTDELTMLLCLFGNRTSLGAFGLSFIYIILTYWITYFLLVYFQACCYQILGTAGISTLLTTTLPALQAPLPETDVAVATTNRAFLHRLGGIWGVAIPSAVFNSQVKQFLPSPLRHEPYLQAWLADGGTYELATKEFMTSLNDQPCVKAGVMGVYVDSLRIVWYVGLAFTILGFLVAFVLEEVPMRESLETEFGLQEKKRKNELEKGSC